MRGELFETFKMLTGKECIHSRNVLNRLMLPPDLQDTNDVLEIQISAVSILRVNVTGFQESLSILRS